MYKFIVFITSIIFLQTGHAQTLQEGMRKIDAMRFDEARQIFTKMMAAEPGNADYYYYTGEIFRRTDAPEDARLQFEKGLKINAENPLCLVGMGSLFLDEKKSDEAKKWFEKALSNTRNKNAKVLLYVGVSLVNADPTVQDLTWAETLLTQAVTLEKNNPDIYIALGDLYLQKGDASKPIANYETALAKDPKYARSYLKKGNLYARARTPEAYQTAVETTQEGIALDPDYAPLYQQLGELYSMTRKFDLAKENYVKYLSMVNNDLYARVRYTQFLFISKDFSKVIEEAKTILSIDTSRPSLYRMLGASLYETGNYTEGIDAYQKYFRKINSNYKISFDDYKYYGLLLQKNNHDSEAIIAYKKAFDSDPSRTDIWSEIGALYRKLKKYNESIEAYKTRLAFKENLNDVYSLGQTYFLAGRNDSTLYDSAVITFNKFIMGKSDFPLAYYWKARSSSYKESKFGIDFKASNMDAFNSYSKFLEMTVSDSVKYKKEIIESLNYLGNYYHFTDKKTECIETWKKILAIEPNNEAGLKFKKFYKF